MVVEATAKGEVVAEGVGVTVLAEEAAEKEEWAVRVEARKLLAGEGAAAEVEVGAAVPMEAGAEKATEV